MIYFGKDDDMIDKSVSSSKSYTLNESTTMMQVMRAWQPQQIYERIFLMHALQREANLVWRDLGIRGLALPVHACQRRVSIRFCQQWKWTRSSNSLASGPAFQRRGVGIWAHSERPNVLCENCSVALSCYYGTMQRTRAIPNCKPNGQFSIGIC